MFANLLQFFTRRPVDEIDRSFITEVHARRPVPRNPRAEKVILLCWGLIAVKHVAVIWAFRHYQLPFHQLWVNFPTFLLGAVATWAYYARD